MILINNFHNREITIRRKVGAELSRAKVRKYWRKLCGMKECLCSNSAGERGSHHIEQIDYDRFIVRQQA